MSLLYHCTGIKDYAGFTDIVFGRKAFANLILDNPYESEILRVRILFKQYVVNGTIFWYIIGLYLFVNTWISYNFFWSKKQKNWENTATKQKKEEIWLSPMTKVPTPTEKSKTQRDNTKNTTKNFDYTMIVDRLRTVIWNNNSHPTGVSFCLP